MDAAKSNYVPSQEEVLILVIPYDLVPDNASPEMFTHLIAAQVPACKRFIRIESSFNSFCWHVRVIVEERQQPPPDEFWEGITMMAVPKKLPKSKAGRLPARVLPPEMIADGDYALSKMMDRVDRHYNTILRLAKKKEQEEQRERNRILQLLAKEARRQAFLLRELEASQEEVKDLQAKVATAPSRETVQQRRIVIETDGIPDAGNDGDDDGNDRDQGK